MTKSATRGPSPFASIDEHTPIAPIRAASARR
jgi:hypothetical protein